MFDAFHDSVPEFAMLREPLYHHADASCKKKSALSTLLTLTKITVAAVVAAAVLFAILKVRGTVVTKDAHSVTVAVDVHAIGAASDTIRYQLFQNGATSACQAGVIPAKDSTLALSGLLPDTAYHLLFFDSDEARGDQRVGELAFHTQSESPPPIAEATSRPSVTSAPTTTPTSTPSDSPTPTSTPTPTPTPKPTPKPITVALYYAHFNWREVKKGRFAFSFEQDKDSGDWYCTCMSETKTLWEDNVFHDDAETERVLVADNTASFSIG